MANQITNEDLTIGNSLTTDTNNLRVTGTGVFDILMSSITIHLESQYLSGRLTGTDYANVYLGSLQTAMQSAVEFLLRRDIAANEIDAKEAEADLYRQRAITEFAQTEQTDKVAPTENSVIGKDGKVKDRQEKAFTEDADLQKFKIITDVINNGMQQEGEASRKYAMFNPSRANQYVDQDTAENADILTHPDYRKHASANDILSELFNKIGTPIDNLDNMPDSDNPVSGV